MAKTALLVVLKVLMILICACFVTLWIVKPTQMWTRKWKEAEDTLRPTVLGYYGLNFVVFTFPVIAVAIVGSIYTSLKLKHPKKSYGRRTFYGLSNPVLVNSLLGTLSGMEILSATLFALLLAWTFYAHIAKDFQKLMPLKTLNLETWEVKYMRIATRSGLLAEVCVALLLLPILRGISLFRLVGIEFEASVRYHVWLGTAMICFATFHGFSTFLLWGVSHHFQEEIWKWQKKGRIYLAGEISLVTGLVIWITALPQIRRRRFEIFYYTHHLYVIFLVFFLFHTGDRHFYSVFAGIFLFGLDKILRIIQSRPETCVVSAKIFPCKAVELTLPKDPSLKYRPTSVIYVKIPSLSKFQWHSFSVTSSSSVDEHTLSIIIRCQGSWTSSLYNLIKDELESDSDQIRRLPIAVEGPYGPTSTSFLRYDSLLLIAGGIGITPFLSILQELSSASKNLNEFSRNVELIYIVKKSQDLCLLNPISHLLTNQSVKQFDLKLKVFVTQEHQSGATFRELLDEHSESETVQFSLDGSIHAINGLESSLSLASITGISSFVFLVILICLNHVFVPNVKGLSMKVAKEKIASSVSDLIVVCSFVVAMVFTSLIALLFRRRRLKRGILLPPLVPVSHGKSRQASFIESGVSLQKHEIHFSGRPVFQDIFAKFRTKISGSDVGVFVCGPETMKESVAFLCRQSFFKIGSDEKTRFSFHSLNFSL